MQHKINEKYKNIVYKYNTKDIRKDLQKDHVVNCIKKHVSGLYNCT